MGSDHLPIRLTLGGVLPQENQHGEERYDYSKADWAAFRQQLETAEYPTQTDDVSQWSFTFRNSGKSHVGFPAMAANMDTVDTFEMAREMSWVGHVCT
ncbi:hypothetical protein ACOMHN_046908 [Nucella lapillus]